MSIYGENTLIFGASAQAAFDALSQRTRTMASVSQLRLFEQQAVQSMAGVANDTSRASVAYKVSLSEAAMRLYYQKAGISTSEPISKLIL
ncbi:hypothetical protein SIID45300_01845 [Candidatus Magnetaquicoccaceae bacterium FCR-1]|uniref:Uncharacterized protein n=1 Tax=Candidatus Magnetaquiglobus chichijimensis TaxID=3141448 RepID=A0ABQ0C9Y4_9PROT